MTELAACADHEEADDGLTIEALGDRHPRLAAQMKIWRRAYESEERLASDGLTFVRAAWGA